LRGGPTAIADRAFQRSIKGFPGQAEPLPQITGPKPQPQATPAPRPIMPPGETHDVPVINTGDTEAQAATRNNNLGRHQATRAFGQAAKENDMDAAGREAARQKANYATRGTRLQELAKRKGLVP
jgi:hypothetical protein